MTGSAVSGEDGALIARQFIEKLTVFWCDNCKQCLRPRLVKNRSIPINQITEGLGLLFWVGHGPEDNVVQTCNSLANGFGMKPIGAIVFKSAGIDILTGGNDKYPGTRLGNPVSSIEQHGADFIRTLAEGLVNHAEILTAICGKKSNDIFEGDDSGLGGHFIKYTQPLPKEPASGS